SEELRRPGHDHKGPSAFVRALLEWCRELLSQRRHHASSAATRRRRLRRSQDSAASPAESAAAPANSPPLRSPVAGRVEAPPFDDRPVPAVADPECAPPDAAASPRARLRPEKSRATTELRSPVLPNT